MGVLNSGFTRVADQKHQQAESDRQAAQNVHFRELLAHGADQQVLTVLTEHVEAARWYNWVKVILRSGRKSTIAEIARAGILPYSTISACEEWNLEDISLYAQGLPLRKAQELLRDFLRYTSSGCAPSQDGPIIEAIVSRPDFASVCFDEPGGSADRGAMAPSPFHFGLTDGASQKWKMT